MDVDTCAVARLQVNHTVTTLCSARATCWGAGVLTQLPLLALFLALQFFVGTKATVGAGPRGTDGEA